MASQHIHCKQHGGQVCVGDRPSCVSRGAMYLLYVDESGEPRGARDDYFTVAGIALHEQDCYPFARSLETLLPTEYRDLELHASDIWSGRREWSHVPQTTRRGLVRDVFQHLRTWAAPSGRVPRFFAVALHKPSFSALNAVERAHEELFARFDEFLTRLHHEGRSHRSLVVADDSSYESLIQELIPKWKLTGSRIGRLHSFAEVPLYVDSRASRVIQAADFVAWGVCHYYENGHREHIQALNARFDARGGIQHGVAHLNRGHRTCLCVACYSRQVSVVKNTVPAL